MYRLVYTLKSRLLSFLFYKLRILVTFTIYTLEHVNVYLHESPISLVAIAFTPAQ